MKRPVDARKTDHGHVFGPFLLCDCGQLWQVQQTQPTVCPLLTAHAADKARQSRTGEARQ